MKRIDVAIGIVVRDGKVLIAQRNPDVPLDGFWEFPGGKCEPGEPPVDCLVREVQEEVGILVRPFAAMEPVEYDYPAGHVRLYPYLCAHLRGQATALQCQQIQWIEPARLRNFRFPPANAGLIEQILARGIAPPPPPARGPISPG